MVEFKYPYIYELMNVCTVFIRLLDSSLCLGQGAIVLDCVVERKTYPDLCCSIMVTTNSECFFKNNNICSIYKNIFVCMYVCMQDQRYQQQKKRLKLSGLRSCMYIVEGPAILV